MAENRAPRPQTQGVAPGPEAELARVVAAHAREGGEPRSRVGRENEDRGGGEGHEPEAHDPHAARGRRLPPHERAEAHEHERAREEAHGSASRHRQQGGEAHGEGHPRGHHHPARARAPHPAQRSRRAARFVGQAPGEPRGEQGGHLHVAREVVLAHERAKGRDGGNGDASEEQRAEEGAGHDSVERHPQGAQGHHDRRGLRGAAHPQRGHAEQGEGEHSGREREHAPRGKGVDGERMREAPEDRGRGGGCGVPHRGRARRRERQNRAGQGHDLRHRQREKAHERPGLERCDGGAPGVEPGQEAHERRAEGDQGKRAHGHGVRGAVRPGSRHDQSHEDNESGARRAVGRHLAFNRGRRGEPPARDRLWASSP